MIDIKRAATENRRVRFTHAHAGNLWYLTEFDEAFPVPMDDMGEATSNAEDKAILFMRYMRKFNSLQSA